MAGPFAAQIQKAISALLGGNNVWTGTNTGIGSSIVHQATRTLTNDEIIHLPTTEIAVVSAAGSGLTIMPIFGSLALHWVADYTNINVNATMAITGYLSVLDEGVTPSQSKVSALLAGGGDAWTYMLPSNSVDEANSSTILASTIGGEPVASENAALTVYIANGGSGILTNGNAGNTLTISVAYLIYNVSTGIFE